MDVNLIIFKTDGSRKDIHVRPGRYVVGRNPDATLRIPLPSVSREHCEIVLDTSGLRVKDLGSSNGTFRNAERVKEAKLAPGDVLGIGPVRLTVQIDGNPKSVQPPARDVNDETGAYDGDVTAAAPTTPPHAPKPAAHAASLAKPAPQPAAKPPAPAAKPAPASAPGVAAPSKAGDDEDLDAELGLGDTLKKPGGRTLADDDSSVFDFDFDFEDDNPPKL